MALHSPRQHIKRKQITDLQTTCENYDFTILEIINKKIQASTYFCCDLLCLKQELQIGMRDTSGYGLHIIQFKSTQKNPIENARHRNKRNRETNT